MLSSDAPVEYGRIRFSGVSYAESRGAGNSGRTAQVAQAFSDGFANDIKAATFQGSNFQQGT